MQAALAGISLGPRLRRPRLKPGVYLKTRGFGCAAAMLPD